MTRRRLCLFLLPDIIPINERFFDLAEVIEEL